MFGVQNVSILGYINGTPPKKKAQGTSNIFSAQEIYLCWVILLGSMGGKEIYQKLSSFFGGPTGKTGRVLQSLF